MSLQADLDWIHKEIDEIKDVSILEKIKMILKSRKKAEERISVEQYNTELDISINQVKEGKTISHENVGNLIKSWSKK